MKPLPVLLLAGLTALVGCGSHTNSVLTAKGAVKSVETIVCLRHGEAPGADLGQLNCRGLNRALALPGVLLAKYGSPQFIFACKPAEEVDGYNYVRALATIEPTAIRCGLPVNTQFGASEIAGLQQELHKPEYKNATVFVAWEHKALDRFVKNLIKANGGSSWQVPSWGGDDYDSIFVVRITRAGGKESVALTIDHEGLNHLSDKCPWEHLGSAQRSPDRPTRRLRSPVPHTLARFVIDCRRQGRKVQSSPCGVAETETVPDVVKGAARFE